MRVSKLSEVLIDIQIPKFMVSMMDPAPTPD